MSAATAQENPSGNARPSAEMTPYTERVPGVEGLDGELVMVPVPGGRFAVTPIGSAEGKLGVSALSVEVDPFWMASTEVTWGLYRVFMLSTDLVDSPAGARGEQAAETGADAVSRPTPPYVPMDFGMGTDGYPAIGMTQFAARQFTKWLSEKTGRFYRLPSEAEWEHACRAGRTGDDPAEEPPLERRAWFAGNSPDRYGQVGTLEPNQLGLHDLTGNVAEWVLDRYEEDWTVALASTLVANAGSGRGAVDAADASAHPVLTNPVAWPSERYPRTVRGGSWRDDAEDVHCGARRGSTPSWQRRDPQLPRSIWYLTDAPFVGFRVVRPLAEPSRELRQLAWEADVDSIRRIEEAQRRGER